MFVVLTEFGRRLDRYIRESDQSGSGFANRIGVHPNTLYKYLAGDFTPSHAVLLRMLRTLHVPRHERALLKFYASKTDRMNQLPVFDRQYCAGFFDKKGSIFESEECITVASQGADLRYYHYFNSVFGFRGKTIFDDEWVIGYQAALRFLDTIEPFMILKRAHVRSLLGLPNNGWKANVSEGISLGYRVGLIESAMKKRINNYGRSAEWWMFIPNKDLADCMVASYGGTAPAAYELGDGRISYRWRLSQKPFMAMIEQNRPYFKIPPEERFIPSGSL